MKKSIILNNQSYSLETEELPEPSFNFNQMSRFTLSDLFLNKVAVDMKTRKPDRTIESILEVIFDSYILDDSAMIHEYNKFA